MTHRKSSLIESMTSSTLQTFHYRTEWLLLGAALLILGAFMGYSLYQEYRHIDAIERDRLQVQAQVIEQNLAYQLEGINNALAGVRDGLFQLGDTSIEPATSQRLKALVDVLPGVRTMLIMNPEGTVLAANRKELIGENFSQRDYFKTVQQRPDPAVLYVSPPFKTTLGVFSVNLLRAATNAQGQLIGIVSVTLDPEYFDVVMRAVLYAPDMWSYLAHEGGQLFLLVRPDGNDEHYLGINLNQTGSFFSQHQALGQSQSILTGKVLMTGEPRLMVLRTLRPEHIPMDKALIVGIGRGLEAIYQQWQQRVWTYSLLYGMLTVVATVGLWMVQRQRWRYEHLTTQSEYRSWETEQLLTSMLDILPVGVWTLNAQGDIITSNPAAQRIWGGARYVSIEQFGEYKGWWLDNGQSIQAHDWAAARAIEKGEISIDEQIEIEAFDGSRKIILNSALPLHDRDGTLKGAIVVNQDITQIKTAAYEIQHLAFHDLLTGLPNRRLLLDRLQHALATSARSQQHGALLFIDLDHFKTLNDTIGHDYGDHLLQQVAERLKATVREGDTVAHLGGDEFIVMLENLSEHAQEAATDVETVSEKIRVILSLLYRIGQQTHRCAASIGAILFNGHQHSTEELLKRAELAMYQAKSAGRNTLRFFDPELQAAVTARAALEVDLREGLEQGQFLLHYQPQVDMLGRLIGAEALVRWQHPQRGLVSPAEFIPLAEETGLILPLGLWVLQTACTQLTAWSQQPNLADLTLAVNVSARQFRHPDFVQQVMTVLERSGAQPQKLKLELTESLLLDNLDDIIAKMTALKNRGIGFALDDFGTGYSSLSYLKRLPLDQLKIDRAFVHEVLTDANDAAIAKMIVALAHSLGLAVIAEGVETEAQRNFLAQHQCYAFQGYLFGRPGPAESLLPNYAARFGKFD